MATDIVVILCTAAPDTAAAMAEQLVSLRLAACVNLYRFNPPTDGKAGFVMNRNTS